MLTWNISVIVPLAGHWMNSAVMVRMWVLCMLTTGGHCQLQLGLDVDADVGPRTKWAVLHQPAVQSPRDAVKRCPWRHRKKAGGCAASSLQLVERNVCQWKQTACTVHYTLKFNPTTVHHTLCPPMSKSKHSLKKSVTHGITMCLILADSLASYIFVEITSFFKWKKDISGESLLN